MAVVERLKQVIVNVLHCPPKRMAVVGLWRVFPSYPTPLYSFRSPHSLIFVVDIYGWTSLQRPPWGQKKVAVVERLKQVIVNVCTVHPKEWLLLKGCCRGEVAVCEGLTVFICVKNVLCFIYHRQLPSLTQLHTLHLRNTQVKTLWYILILNNIFLSVFVQCELELYRVWWYKWKFSVLFREQLQICQANWRALSTLQVTRKLLSKHGITVT